MILTLLTIILAVCLTTFLGYWAHWAFHQEWSGPFYKAHSNHHTLQYPSNDLTSDVYRSAGKDNTFWYFVAAFLPVIASIVAATLFFGISFWTAGWFIIGMVATGLLHDQLHDSFHLNKTYWQLLPFYKQWQKLHFLHHFDQVKNYGIFNFTLDRLFKTYRDS